MLGRLVQVGAIGILLIGGSSPQPGQREVRGSFQLLQLLLVLGQARAQLHSKRHQLVLQGPSVSRVRCSERQTQCALTRSTGPFPSASPPAFHPNCLPYWPTATSGQPLDSSPAPSLLGDFSLILQPLSFRNLTSLALPQFCKVWSLSQIPFSVPLTVVPFCLPRLTCTCWESGWGMEWQMNPKNGTPNPCLLITAVKPSWTQERWQRASQHTQFLRIIKILHIFYALW